MSDENELTRLSGDVAELQDDMGAVKEKLVEHQTRFGNGMHAMADIRKKLEKLMPKAPDWLKLFGAGMAVVAILMAGQLWITDRLNEKASRAEVDKSTAPIKAAQKETALEIKEIEKSQSAQQTSIENIEKVQEQQGGKLDDILLRLPLRRRDR